MARLFFITHPEVAVDPARPAPLWPLSPAGIARMQAFAADPDLAQVTAIWSSDEAKTREAAALLGQALGLAPQVAPDLGEVDRSSTGWLSPADFDAAVTAFFAEPGTGPLGWEAAAPAQARITRAVAGVLAGHGPGDLAIVSHGTVGALFLCALQKVPITRSAWQPFPGHVFQASLPDLALISGWRPIAPRG